MLKILVAFAIAFGVGSGMAKANDVRVFFLRGGEVWSATPAGANANSLTATQGTIEDYQISPDGKYLAVLKIFKHVGAPGIWKKPGPDSRPGIESASASALKPVAQIRVNDLEYGTLLADIRPPEDNWFYLKRWLDDTQLLYVGASGFDVWGHFVYHVASNRSHKIYDYQGYRLIYGSRLDFDPRSKENIFVEVTPGSDGQPREELRLRDLASGHTQTLFSRAGIRWPRWSHDGRQIAFLEVGEMGGSVQDTLWIFKLADRSMTRGYQAAIRPKGENGLAWSPGDRYVLMDLKPSAVVVDVLAPGKWSMIKGGEPVWLDSQTLIYSDAQNLRLSQAPFATSRIVIPDAVKPQLAPARP